jgi:hypothetical protein
MTRSRGRIVSRRSIMIAPLILGGILSGRAEASAAPALSRCEKDAMRLEAPVIVRSGPHPRFKQISELGPGVFVHRCEKRKGWRRILFPVQGGYADCFRRASARACSSGWIPDGVELKLFGSRHDGRVSLVPRGWRT